LAEAPTDVAARRTWLRITIALFLVALAANFAQFGSTAALADVAKHFGHPSSSKTIQSVVGLSGSELSIGLAILRVASLGALPLASLADHWGRTTVLRRTLFVGLIITACASLSPSYWIFVLLFALARPLMSTTTTIVSVVSVELSSTRGRIDRLVVIAAGAGIGSGLAAIFHGLIRGPDSFRWLFALAIVPVLFLEPLLRRVPEPTFRSTESPLAHLGAIPRGGRGRVAIVGAVVFLIGVISGPAGGFVFVYSESVLKMSPRAVALVVTLSGLTGLVGLLLSRYLARVAGRRWSVALGTLASAGTSLLAYGGGRTAFVVGYMSGVAAGGLLAPSIAAMGTELFAHRYRATAAGWIVVAGVLGAVVGLIVFGLIGDSVHITGAGSFRLPALFTFLPLLPLLLLMTRLPESSTMELT